MDLIQLALAHVAAENHHSLKETLDTIGPNGAYYKVYSSGETLNSRKEIEAFYGDVMEGVPDMFVEVEHIMQDVEKREVFVQYKFSGTHRGVFNGLLPTGKKLQYNGAILYRFDENGKLTAEINYFDKTEILASIGVIRDTKTQLGQFLLMFFQSPIYTLRCGLASMGAKKK